MFLPGTEIEVSAFERGISLKMFEGIFAGGGITLSQVSIMTGIETYAIQNWVKRGFVSSPKKRTYSKNQFSRIVIINMLRQSLQLDKICSLISYINGSLSDESDDLIEDSQLYHLYVDMVAGMGGIVSDYDVISSAAKIAAESYAEPVAGARARLVRVLEIMAYAHYSAISKNSAERLIREIEQNT